MSVHLKCEPGAFGSLDVDTPLDMYHLSNSNGVSVRITNYGGTIVSIHTPDKNGEIQDSIVLGFDNLADYQTHARYFGCIVGRFCNRIAHGKFMIEGDDGGANDRHEYTVATNNNSLHHLHGGWEGFDRKVWTVVEQITNDTTVGIRLQYESTDGEEGYPGNLKVQVTYTLNTLNELKIDYICETDKTTIVNLTNHSYFNLTGRARSETILNHLIMINADKYTVVDDTLIPTGELKSVSGTPLDFTSFHPIGERIHQIEPGYDHNYVLRKGDNEKELSLAAYVHDPHSGRTLQCLTTQPGMQFYTGNFLRHDLNVFTKYHGFCLETQHFPDSPNHPEFPTTVLKPGDRFHETTIFKFGVEQSVHAV